MKKIATSMALYKAGNAAAPEEWQFHIGYMFKQAIW